MKAIDAIRDGVKAGVVNDVGRRVIDERGYGGYFPFGIGHGLGLEVHEIPHLTESRDMEMVLQPGMVMTIDPTVNLPGELTSALIDYRENRIKGSAVMDLLDTWRISAKPPIPRVER